MMILAPSPLFLDYISAVLPDLGVEQVVQTTFSRYIASLLAKRMPKLVEEDRLERMLALGEEARQEEAAILRFAGSLRFRELLLAYVAWLENRIVPQGDLTFGPAVLYTHGQMLSIFLTELKPFPFERRMAEIPKYLAKAKERRGAGRELVPKRVRQARRALMLTCPMARAPRTDDPAVRQPGREA